GSANREYSGSGWQDPAPNPPTHKAIRPSSRPHAGPSRRGQGGPEVVALAAEETHRDGRFFPRGVEGVERAVDDLLVHRDAGLAQTPPIVQTLLVEQVQRPDADPCGRPAGPI